MPRPVWNGTISFGLVAIPIKLYHAVSKKAISFNQLDQRSMSRIKLRKVSADTGEEVPDDEIVKGYEISKGRYILVDPDELEPFIPSATHSIDLEEFVDLDQLDPAWFDAAYIVAPDKTPKPYALLAKAMEDSGKVAIGKFVMRNKQYVAAIRAKGGHLLMSTLVFAEEVVGLGGIDELQQLDGIEVSDREALMAEALVESLSAEFDHTKYSDAYRSQVLELIERKASGDAFEAPVAAKAAPAVVDLMAALEASVKAAKEARKRHPTGSDDAASHTATSAEVGHADGATPDNVTSLKAARAKKSA